jgi:hypothetical protein
LGAQTKEKLPNGHVGGDRGHDDGSRSAGHAQNQQYGDGADEQPSS